MADSKNTFIVYADDIKETLDGLDNEQVAALFRGMVDYQITGNDPEFDGVLKFVFIPIRRQMDRDCAKWQTIKEKRARSGRSGGVKSGETRREKVDNEAKRSKRSKCFDDEANEANASKSKQTKQNEANEAVNVNVNVNDNVNVNVNDNVNVNVSDSFAAVSDDPLSLSSLLISYLNEKAGSKYRVTNELTERIGSLLSEHYTAEDMRLVVDKKVAEWKDDDKMRGYLRPRTLFGPKFYEYVDAPEPVEVEKKRNDTEQIERLKEDKLHEEESLDRILEQMKEIRNGPGIEAAYDKYSALSDQRIIREQNLEIIQQKLERLQT